jgi:ferredoxin
MKGGAPLAHVISDECINCGACEDSCPTNAISEVEEKRIIDADTCIDCGACVDTCPVIAISGA